MSASEIDLNTQLRLHIDKEKVIFWKRIHDYYPFFYFIEIYSTSSTLECLNSIVDNISNNNDGSSSNTLCTPTTSNKKSFPQ